MTGPPLEYSFAEDLSESAGLVTRDPRAAVISGSYREGEIWKEVAYAYGCNRGIAFHASAFNHFIWALSEWFCVSDSLWAALWTMNPLESRWASLAVLTYNSVSQRVRPYLHGRSIQSSARSSSTSVELVRKFRFS